MYQEIPAYQEIPVSMNSVSGKLQRKQPVPKKEVVKRSALSAEKRLQKLLEPQDISGVRPILLT